MVNPLTSDFSNLLVGEVHQFLHGYSDGHRLIEGSVKLPSDLARLMLKMSDLSGSSVVSGFERYITGYPLESINAYALAMTWYASEMPRPGCVWTHTITLPVQTLATISSLVSLTKLFRRPKRGFLKSDYAETISFERSPVQVKAFDDDMRFPHPDSLDVEALKGQLGAIFSAYYGSPQFSPVVLVARDSDEFSGAIFALWSQQWPRLRQRFLFCTGSLSGRSFDGRKFDIQCSPPTAAKDVAREAAAEPLRVEAILIPTDGNTYPPDLESAVDDAVLPNGGGFRTFLWESVDDSADREDVSYFAKIYDAVNTSQSVNAVIHLVAESFPEPNRGTRLKQLLFGNDRPDFVARNFQDRDILFSLATTTDFQVFDSEALSIEDRITRLCASNPDEARWLLRQLFEATVNDLGEQILSALIVHMNAETAQEITRERPKFLPGLFRARPDLARSPELWKLGGDRKRELFEAVAGQKELDSPAIHGIVAALLESNSEGFFRRAIDHWGKDAVFSILDWIDSHEGRMSRASREALSNQPDLAMDWVQEKTDRSPASLLAVAHVVAPYASRVSERDSEVWLRTFREVQGTATVAEKDYLASFLLTLAFCNAPPAPLDLVAESYQRVHQAAWEDRLSDEAWSIAEPFVPELSWLKNWDKCERLNRGLIAAFIRHRWPSSGLRRVKNYYPRNSSTDLMQQIFQSARDVKGGKELVRNVERDA
jgi:hypothetical protein